MPRDPSGSWMTKANCIEDPDIFFDYVSRTDEIRAKDLCHECEVMEVCLEYALSDKRIEHGIWGGLNSKELKRARKRRARVRN